MLVQGDVLKEFTLFEESSWLLSEVDDSKEASKCPIHSAINAEVQQGENL